MLYHDVSIETSLAVTARRYYPRKLVVLHTTMGADSLPWLQGGSARAGRPASADFLIYRNGDVMQITRPGWYAYHSGNAYWRGIQDPNGTLNQSAVGVEFECLEHFGERITDEQYIAGAALLRRLFTFHHIDPMAVTTHSIVALPPGRKVDPIYLDWFVMMRELINPSAEAEQLIFPAVLP